MIAERLVAGSASGADEPRRALVLAGGGMRVAYQAGVIRALIDSGLTFGHADGTSGGTINVAMLFSGLSPEEMCRRWRTLDVKDFVSLMPLHKYLKAHDMLAMGDADGIVEKVFPHLGIDVPSINKAQGMTASFNVCNFSKKTNEAVFHEDVTLDHLVAGISLAGLMPPVRIGEDLYTDSVWIKDANLMEAVRRGAEELWLVWCIGNTPSYYTGMFKQYVHMIEMSANGVLFEEFDRIVELNERISNGDSPFGQRKAIKLHVVKPRYALPLDPDLYLGRIDTATLIDLGYRDAKHYLTERSEQGIPFTHEATRMIDNPIGITFREKMEGPFAMGPIEPGDGRAKGVEDGSTLAMYATIHIRDLSEFVDSPDHAGEITGRIDFTPFGSDIPASNGVFNLFSDAGDKSKHMIYELGFEFEGQEYYLAGRKVVRDDPGPDAWSDTTKLFTKLHRGRDQSAPIVGSGVLELSLSELAKLMPTIRVTGDASIADKARAYATFGGFFLGELWNTYKHWVDSDGE